MEKIPTALELFQIGEFTKIQDAMVEFAKLHVEAALKEASKKSKNKEGQIIDHILTNSILNSYSLDNIK